MSFNYKPKKKNAMNLAKRSHEHLVNLNNKVSKTKTILITAIIFSQLLFGQSNLYVGIQSSPDYAFMNKQNLHKSITPILSHTTGLNALYKTSTHFQIELGVLYSVRRTKSNNLIDSYKYECYKNNTTATNIWETYSTKYIDIPIKIDYLITKKANTPFISVGISSNIYLFDKINVYAKSENTNKSLIKTGKHNLNNKAIETQLLLSCGIDFNKNNLKFRIEPIYRHSLSNSATSENYEKKFYSSVGLNFGMFITFWNRKNICSYRNVRFL